MAKFKEKKDRAFENENGIPKDLADQWSAVEACATAFNCLNQGLFTHQYMSTVKASLNFLKLLHQQSVQVAMKHPKAELIPELKLILEEDARAKAEGAQGEVEENKEAEVGETEKAQ